MQFSQLEDKNIERERERPIQPIRLKTVLKTS